MRLGTAGVKSAGRPRIQTPQAGQVVLSLAGGPFFIWLLLKQRRGSSV